MTDRELLELAAKAVGLVGYVWDDTPFYEGFVRRNFDPPEDGGLEVQSDFWNPLIDNGDALRLAVALGIGLLPEATDVRKGTAICHERFGWHIFTGLPDEPQAAARHAIVRAAAAIAQQRGSGEA